MYCFCWSIINEGLLVRLLACQILSVGVATLVRSLQVKQCWRVFHSEMLFLSWQACVWRHTLKRCVWSYLSCRSFTASVMCRISVVKQNDRLVLLQLWPARRQVDCAGWDGNCSSTCRLYCIPEQDIRDWYANLSHFYFDCDVHCMVCIILLDCLCVPHFIFKQPQQLLPYYMICLLFTRAVL